MRVLKVIDDIANIIRFGGCVVMGIGVTPERYRFLLQDATSQDYMVVGPKDSEDANFIASRLNGELLEPLCLTVSGVEMNIYLIRSEKVQS
ncbi:MAG TPA: hypothetical protein VK206_16975 [Anaerolineales bacterium]|nr:hypothetical protein [Anaerolineales bacterium]HLO34335.1 hypothetical protein [Anaerolineales bacterium]